MTVECLTFSETLEFCSPTNCQGCGDRTRCRNCPSNNLCLTKIYSPVTGKQTTLIIGKKRRCCPCSRRHRKLRH